MILEESNKEFKTLKKIMTLMYLNEVGIIINMTQKLNITHNQLTQRYRIYQLPQRTHQFHSCETTTSQTQTNQKKLYN